MKTNIKLKALQETRKKINNIINSIVLDGGYVGLGDPLSIQLGRVSREISKLSKCRSTRFVY